MADEADDAPPPPPKKSGGFMGTLINGMGIFVADPGAPSWSAASSTPSCIRCPTCKLDKDGKITAIVPRRRGGHGEEGEAPASRRVYYAIDPPLVVNFEDGSVVRFLQITMEVMAHDRKAIESVQKNIPLIRNNLLLLMSNRNYQTHDVARRQGKAAPGGARRSSRRAEEGRRSRTSTTAVHQLRGAVMAEPTAARTQSPTKRSRHCSRRTARKRRGGATL